MYRVVQKFDDLQDTKEYPGGHPYNPGDQYPHDGRKVPAGRIKELSGDKNKRGFPLIAEYEDEPPIIPPEYTAGPNRDAEDYPPYGADMPPRGRRN